MICAHCKRYIQGRGKVWLVEHNEFCSRDCAVEHYAEYYNVEADGIEYAESYVDTIAKEVSSITIGLVEDEHEEADTQMCDWCYDDIPLNKLINTDFGMICKHCLRSKITKDVR